MIQLHLNDGQTVKGYRSKSDFEKFCEKMVQKKEIRVECAVPMFGKIFFFKK